MLLVLERRVSCGYFRGEAHYVRLKILLVLDLHGHLPQAALWQSLVVRLADGTDEDAVAKKEFLIEGR